MPGGHTPFGTRGSQSKLNIIDPASLPNLELYFRSNSADVASLADGANVLTWADQSGKARNSQEIGVGQSPVYRAGANASPTGIGLVGLDAHPFTGGAELANPAAFSLTTVRGMTLYIWYRRTATDTAFGDQPVLFGLGDGFGGFVQTEDSGGGIIPPFNWPSAHLDWRIQGGGTSFRDCGPVTTGNHVFSLVLPPGGSGGQARQDGVPIGPAGTWSLHDLGGSYGFVIGNASNANATSRLRVGAIALFTDAHSARVVSGVEAFLRKTWG